MGTCSTPFFLASYFLLCWQHSSFPWNADVSYMAKNKEISPCTNSLQWQLSVLRRMQSMLWNPAKPEFFVKALLVKQRTKLYMKTLVPFPTSSDLERREQELQRTSRLWIAAQLHISRALGLLNLLRMQHPRKRTCLVENSRTERERERKRVSLFGFTRPSPWT